MFVYGTSNGVLGAFTCNNTNIKKVWTHQTEEESGGITAIAATDITHNGIQEILVGREDGRVQVYGFFEGPTLPKLVYTKSVGESIQSIGHAHMISPDKEDIVVVTYSGNVILLNERPPVTSATKEARDSSVDKRMKELKADIDKLGEKLEQERKKFDKVAQESSVAVPLPQTLNINDRFVLIPQEACYSLTIEIASNLDCILLQANLPLEITDVNKSISITTVTAVTGGDHPQFLATTRVMEDSKRVELKVRATNGQAGQLIAFVMPLASPKTCQTLIYNIKPLSLYYRVQLREIKGPLPEFSELKITGVFTLTEMHSWIAFCLSDVPDVIRSEDPEITYYFVSSFSGTILQCQFSQNMATFGSDSIVTLLALKETISREATARGSKISINTNIRDQSITDVLRMYDEKASYQLSLSKKVKLIQALQEIRSQEPNMDFLSIDLKTMLDNAEEIKKQLEQQPRELNFIFEMFVEMYIARQKFKGKNPTKTADLKRVLETNYSLNHINHFFEV
eukprot:TRINITY_DN7982_c0_g1_i1.p1 TRINITY_DN7982_c0_g1~~TRINITY_DN7982_c0_g1_i1.p1  ORF type:complete len:512 (+),score=109.64 TRINITY_DN7982_c0_g1_i1:607-2142(+)